MPLELRVRILQYYDMFLSRSELFDDDGILPDLTENLRREMLLHLNRDIIAKIPLLSSIDPGFMAHVFSVMTPGFALPFEIIVQVRARETACCALPSA